MRGRTRGGRPVCAWTLEGKSPGSMSYGHIWRAPAHRPCSTWRVADNFESRLTRLAPPTAAPSPPPRSPNHQTPLPAQASDELPRAAAADDGNAPTEVKREVAQF